MSSMVIFAFEGRIFLLLSLPRPGPRMNDVHQFRYSVASHSRLLSASFSFPRFVKQSFDPIGRIWGNASFNVCFGLKSNNPSSNQISNIDKNHCSCSFGKNWYVSLRAGSLVIWPVFRKSIESLLILNLVPKDLFVSEIDHRTKVFV